MCVFGVCVGILFPLMISMSFCWGAWGLGEVNVTDVEVGCLFIDIIQIVNPQLQERGTSEAISEILSNWKSC